MKSQCWRLLLMILWSFEAKGFYHLKSIQRLPVPKNITEDAFFGYSLAYQPTTKRLIVSAPNSGIGKIYDCNLQDKKCREIQNPVPLDYESVYGNMWLGATLATKENFTMACAPRHMEWNTMKGTFGKCFVTSPNSYNMTLMKSVSRDEKYQKEMKGQPYVVEEMYMDSFGWSIHATENGHVLVGGPAMFRGRVMEYSSIDSEPKLLNYATSKPNNNNWQVNYNFGYSVTSGNYISKSKKDIIYAMSSPYGKLGFGLIIMYDGARAWLLTNPHPHTPGVGAMFGTSMASASLETNGRQALLVGAPGYTQDKSQFDLGALYVYQYNNEKKTVLTSNIILGTVIGGRFGSAIISLGDLNGDNSDEIAVAAPYESPGAVYIYSGAQLARGDSQAPYLQKIYPEGFTASGLSLAALQDYDNNGCNELAIGAPESNTVVLLSCMATITVEVLKLQEKRALRKETSFVFESCLDIKYPDKLANVSAEIQVKISITHVSARLGKPGGDGSKTRVISIRDKTQSRSCEDITVIMPAESQDRKIQYEIKATQLKSPINDVNFNPERVLVSDRSKLMVSDNLWLVDCDGKLCEPKFEKESIKIISTIPNNYIIGSSATEKVKVRTRNSGDTAYGVCLQLVIRGVEVLRYPPSWKRKQSLLVSQSNKPVKQNTDWETEEIELDMQNLNSDTKEISFLVTVAPLCSSKLLVNKKFNVTIQPDPTKLMLRGSTNIGDIVEATTEELKDTGKHISHDYSILNVGITDWVNIKFELTLRKEPFFQMFDVNIKDQCSSPVDIGEDYKIECNINELKKNEKLAVMLPIYILPGNIDKEFLRNSNVTISSQLKLIYGDSELRKSVITIIKLKDSSVPLWIIIIAALVGLLIIVIIVFALYECGLLRRQNKDKLRRLKRSVHRQSVYRNSMRSTQRQSSDKQKLVEENPRNSDATGEENCENSPPENVGDVKDPVERTEENNQIAPLIHLNDNIEKPLKSIPEDEEYQIKKKEQIIQGLQKNLNRYRTNQFS